jgi:TolB protein
MDMNGVGAERISPGTGEASNPSWHPNGQILAFAWTRGYGDNGWNIFTMGAARREPQQLTNNQGKNEHPAWAPDGIHLVFDSTRTGTSQIWSMWADGSHLRQLTTQGINGTPAWGK